MHDSEQEHSGITGCRVTYESTIFYNEANKSTCTARHTTPNETHCRSCNRPAEYKIEGRNHP